MNKDMFVCIALTIFLAFIMMFMVWDATKPSPVPRGYHYERTENIMYDNGNSYRIINYYTKDTEK